MKEMAQICETLYRKIKWKKEKEKRETNLWSEIGSKHRSGFVVDQRIFLCLSLSVSGEKSGVSEKRKARVGRGTLCYAMLCAMRMR